MNERIRELAEEAGFMSSWFSESGDNCEPEIRKFAELLKAAIYNNVKEWLSTESQISDESDPMVREYLKGYNSGNVDALCEIQNFGLDIEP
jgi:VIT1/CCC1 family predicted Fe2+/Mn2+ transporter